MVFVHPTADVHASVSLGEDTKVWDYVKIRENVRIGSQCSIGRNCYIDSQVIIGNNVKLQNGINVWHGVTLHDFAFVGPSVIFTNDRFPRSAIWDDERLGFTVVEEGASLGANSTIVCGTREHPRCIGSYALVAAGALVTKDVAPHHLVMGSPARPVAYVCTCGHKAEKKSSMQLYCPVCKKTSTVSLPLQNL